MQNVSIIIIPIKHGIVIVGNMPKLQNTFLLKLVISITIICNIMHKLYTLHYRNDITSHLR